MSFVAKLCLFFGFLEAQAQEVKSVTGVSLNTCSKPGTALTGFTRDGHCQDQGDDDAGSHHICIEMKPDFCTVTGQSNWCGDEMSCMGQSGSCPIGNWCVCQWAFARYIQMAGGCDAIVELVCDATNLAAVHAYEKERDDPTIKAALECIQQRCGQPQPLKLNDAENPPVLVGTTRKSSVDFVIAGAAVVAVVASFAASLLKMRYTRSANDRHTGPISDIE